MGLVIAADDLLPRNAIISQGATPHLEHIIIVSSKNNQKTKLGVVLGLGSRLHKYQTAWLDNKMPQSLTQN